MKTSVSTAGTSSCRADGAGRVSSGYTPPWPGDSAIIVTCAAAATAPSSDERKSTAPASNATRTAIGTSTRGLVLDDERGVDACELRHGREERMPEREGITGMEPASRELVEPPRRERAQLDELADARDVERRVSGERSRRDVPEEQSEHEPGEGHGVPALDRRLFRACSARAEHERSQSEREQDEERERRTTPRTANTTPSATVSAARAHASVAEVDRSPSARAMSQPGKQDDERRGAEPEEEPETVLREQARQSERREHRRRVCGARRHRPASSSGTLPLASQRAIRRYCRSRGARRRQPASTIQRVRAAARAPSCFAMKRRMPAHVLAEHAPRVRGAGDVRELRVGREEHLPARAAGTGSTSRSPR